MASMDLLFRFLGVDAGAGREFDRMAGKASAGGAALTKFALGATAVGATVAAVSVDMAAKFQTSMTRLQTQANVSAKNVAVLSHGILGMAGSVATSPQVLSEAAYHIASFGQKSLTTAQQLKILRTASEGAKLGGADLVDVTNALDGVLAMHIKGIRNYGQAMGVLNATVGAGDMKMQDLAEALPKVGITAKQAGVNINEVGAALAVFGDNNLRGALAGTQFRMAIQALEEPAKQGVAALNGIGISSTKLAKDMQRGGLTKAIADLRAHMIAAGDTGDKVGAFLTDAFGKRAGQGLGYLEGEFGRFQNKLKETSKGGASFASSWKTYTKTFGYAWDNAVNAAHALFIELGTALLPTATKLMNWIGGTAIPVLGKFGHWLTQPSGVVETRLVPALEHLWSFIRTKVVPAFEGVLKDALQGAENAFHRIGSAIQHNKPQLETILGAFKAFASFIYTKVVPVLGPILGGTLELLGMAWAAQITVLAKVTAAGKAVVHFFTGPFIHGIGEFVSIFIKGLKYVADAAMTAFGVIVHAGSKALGWVPFIGRGLKSAAKAFDGFKTNVDGTLSRLASDAASWGTKTGTFYAHGLIGGMNAQESAVINKAAELANAMDRGARSPAGAHTGSPSKKAIRVGQWYAQGLAIGLSSHGREIYLSGAQVARQLAVGLTEGFHNEALRVEHSFSNGIQTVLSNVETRISTALKKQQALLKTYTSKLQSDLKSRNQAIGSLSSSISGNAGISNIFGSDANGAPMVGNLRTYLTGQAGVYSRYAGLFAKARKLGLSPNLLNQITQLSPGDAITVLSQITSGQDGSISSLNALQGRIGTSAKQIATGATNSPAELASLRADRREVRDQTHTLHRIEEHLRHFREHPNNTAQIHIALHELGFSDAEIRRLIARINQVEHRLGTKKK